MTVHTDTKNLPGYNAGSYPTIDGGVPKYITTELQKLQNSVTSLVNVVKLLEARMNTNGLT